MRNSPLRSLGLLILGVGLASACSEPKADAGAQAGAAEQRAALGAQVATIVDLRGQGGLASPELGEGTFLGKQAPLHSGQRISTPAGLRAELALLDGTRVRIDEQSELKMPVDAGPLEVITGRVIVVAGQEPARILSHGEQLEISAGRAQIEATPDARTWSVLAGRGELKLPDQSIELRAGASLGTPLARSAPQPQPVLSLEPLHSSAWAQDFEQAKSLAAGLPPGVGSLTARRPNTQSQTQPLRLAEQKVRVTIRGRVAHTEIEQAFVNDSGVELEGTYRFPLPADASISGLQLLVGSKWMEGAMVEKTRARQIFKSIVDRVVPRDPALFEWEQGNVFKLKIFPLPARGERRVRLSYTQQLDEVEPGQLRYRYPMGGSGAGATQIGVFDFDVAVDASNLAGVNLDQVRTPMMQLDRRSADGNLYLHRRETRFSPSHELGVDVPAPASGMVTHTDRDGQTYFMLSMRPEFAAPPTEAVDYVFVADRSHATAPELWTASQGLIEASLEALDPNDRFTVLACDTACDALSPTLLAADPDTRLRVKAFLGQQRIGGASDIRGMLEHASGLMPPRSGGTRVVVYLGDGVASSGELSADGLVSFARSEAMSGIRLEAVALGARADDLVLGALTEATGGDLIHAGISDDLGAVARELQYRARVPALHDLDLQLPSGAYDVHPRDVPPLRSGEELIVTGKLRRDYAAQDTRATLRRPSTGEETSAPLAANDIGSRNHPYLPRLWAAEQINWLTTHRGYAAKKEIVALSQDYTVMSRYTALLALENDAMYRQYAVRRRGNEKDRWRGELNLGQPQLAWNGPLRRSGVSATGAPAQIAGGKAGLDELANDPAPAAQAKAKREDTGAWDFVGDRKEGSRANGKRKGDGDAQPMGGAPTTVDAEEPIEEDEIAEAGRGAEEKLAANLDTQTEAAKGLLGKSGGGTVDATSTPVPNTPSAAPEAEPSPWPGDAPTPDASAGADRDKDQADFAKNAEDFDEADNGSAAGEDPFGPLGTSGPGSSAQSGSGGASKAPSKKKKSAKPRRPRPSSSPLDMADGGGGGGYYGYDDPPMIAKRPPRPKVRVKAATGISQGALRRIDDLLRRRESAPTDRARHRALVSAAMRAGDKRAVQWAADWAESDPDHFRALIAHADALSMRAHPMAMRAYESATEANPFSDDLHRWLAVALEVQGDFERACSHRRAVVSIDPSKVPSHIALAKCLDAARRGQAANEALAYAATKVKAKDRRTIERAVTGLLNGSGRWAPPNLPRYPGVRAELSFDPNAELDVAFIDHRGRRLSADHPEGGVAARRERGKVTLTLRRYSRPLYVEVTRKDSGRAPVRASLSVRTSDSRRSFEVNISQGNQRVAYVYKK